MENPSRFFMATRCVHPVGRRSWWETKRTTCLANQWGVVPMAGKIELHSERTQEAKQIADASYDPATERLRATFRDGTTVEVITQP